MRKIIITLSLLVTNQFFAQQPDIEMNLLYGGFDEELLNAAYPTADGGYIMVGSSDSNEGEVYSNMGVKDFLIIKISNDGDFLWSRSYGGSHDDIANDIKQTIDGGYIVVGTTYSSDGDVTGFHGTYGSDIWVLKLNANGNIQWKKALGTNAHDYGEAILQTSDGGYLVVGSADQTPEDTGDSPSDFFAAKLSPQGNILWEESYGGSQYDKAYSAVETVDGSFIIVGSAYSNDGDITVHNGEADVWVINISPTGLLQWEKSYGGPNIEAAYSIKQTEDAGFIIAAHQNTQDLEFGERDILILKITGTGAIQWQETYGGSGDDWLPYIEVVEGSGYIFSARSNSSDGDVENQNYTGESDAWIVKLDNSGNIVWKRIITGDQQDFISTIIPIQGGGYFLAGGTNSLTGDRPHDPDWTDFWAIKLGADPLSVEDNNVSKFAIYPNPVSSELYIDSGQMVIDEVFIIDVMGKKINVGMINNSVNTEHLQPGIYMISIISAGRTSTTKFIKN